MESLFTTTSEDNDFNKPFSNIADFIYLLKIFFLHSYIGVTLVLLIKMLITAT